jgi:hypothetical protein
MKKLLITMAFISAIILASSCTADNFEETENATNTYNKKTISSGVIDSITVKTGVLLYNGDNDKDRVKL